MTAELSSGKIYGVFGEFAEPEQLVSAAKKAREKGYCKLEAFTPYPVEELQELLGHEKEFGEFDNIDRRFDRRFGRFFYAMVRECY